MDKPFTFGVWCTWLCWMAAGFAHVGKQVLRYVLKTPLRFLTKNVALFAMLCIWYLRLRLLRHVRW